MSLCSCPKSRVVTINQEFMRSPFLLLETTNSYRNWSVITGLQIQRSGPTITQSKDTSFYE